MSFRKDITEMLFASGTTAGNNGNLQIVCQLRQCLIGITGFHAIMIHTREENLASTTLLHFMCPFKESSLCALAATFQITMPSIRIKSGINGYDANLTTKAGCNFFNQFWSANSSAVNTHFVGASIQHSLNICQLVDTSTNSKGDVELLCYFGHHISKGLSALETGGDIQKHQLVGTSLTIGFAQFYRVASTPKVYEVDALHCLTVLDV